MSRYVFQKDHFQGRVKNEWERGETRSQAIDQQVIAIVKDDEGLDQGGCANQKLKCLGTTDRTGSGLAVEA